MTENEQDPPKEPSAVHRLADTLLSTARNRAELFALEVEEEQSRLIVHLCWVVVSLLLSVATVAVITVTIVAWTPEKARPFVLLGFSCLYLLAAAAAVFNTRKLFKNRPPPFSNTVAELKKDFAWLRSRR